MALTSKSLPILLLVALFLAIGGAQAPSEKDASVAPVRACSDSLLSTVVAALADSDSARLASIFFDSVGVVMPGGKVLNGKRMVTKYFPLFLQTFGGAGLTTTRLKIENIKGNDHMAREAGEYTLTKQVDSTHTQQLSGHYTVYWERRDSVWLIERIFIADR
jgi:uncharacterized protein (TIGR02246 family)